MNHKHLLIAVSLLTCLAITAPVGAQSGTARCEIQMTRPNPGQEAGSTVNVEGTAKLPPDHYLWVFARHESFRGLGQWWPQNTGVVDPDTGRWRVKAYLGGPQDVGDDFDVAVAGFAPREHGKLREWLQEGGKTGHYPPIEMPAAACPPVLRVVRKTSHK